jgi:hypothetical protein
MTEVTAVSVLAQSTEPLTGILLFETAAGGARFELTEHLAHKLCTELERFLTGDGSPVSAGPAR